MIEKITKIIKPKDFIKDLKKQGIIKNKKGEYAYLVKNTCNNASAYIYLNLIDHLTGEELTNFYCHNGYYKEGKEEFQHSWISFDNKIIDLTLKQFNNNYEDFYIGIQPKELHTRESINFSDIEGMLGFLKRL